MTRRDPPVDDYDAYLKTWKFRPSLNGHREYVINPNVTGWKRFLLCGRLYLERKDTVPLATLQLRAP